MHLSYQLPAVSIRPAKCLPPDVCLPAFRRASPESTPSSHVRLDTDGVDVVVVPRRAVEFGAGLVAEQALLQINLRGGLRQRVLLHLLTCGGHQGGGMLEPGK